MKKQLLTFLKLYFYIYQLLTNKISKEDAMECHVYTIPVDDFLV